MTQTNINPTTGEVTRPTTQQLAVLLADAQTCEELKHIKSTYGEAPCQQAWKTLDKATRDYLWDLCHPTPEDYDGVAEEEENLAGDTIQPQTAKCKSCNAEIIWGELNGKPHPYNPDGMTHFATCPHANSHRKKPQQPQPKKRTLFDISDDLTKLDDLLDDPEISDIEQQEIIREFLEDTKLERDVKLDNYAEYILDRKARAKALKERATAMMELATTAENLAQRLQDNLQWFFEKHDLKKVETPRHRISHCRNGGKQPIGLDVESPEDLPQQFQRVRVEANLTAIREALESGEDLDAIAHWKEKGSHLRIK